MIDTGFLSPFLSLVLAVGTFFVGRTTSANAKGAADGEMKADIKHIKANQEELTEKPVTLAIKEVAAGELTATLKDEYMH